MSVNYSKIKNMLGDEITAAALVDYTHLCIRIILLQTVVDEKQSPLIV